MPCGCSESKQFFQQRRDVGFSGLTRDRWRGALCPSLASSAIRAASPPAVAITSAGRTNLSLNANAGFRRLYINHSRYATSSRRSEGLPTSRPARRLGKRLTRACARRPRCGSRARSVLAR